MTSPPFLDPGSACRRGLPNAQRGADAGRAVLVILVMMVATGTDRRPAIDPPRGGRHSWNPVGKNAIAPTVASLRPGLNRRTVGRGRPEASSIRL